jgi:hypothetical protein
MDQWEYMVLVGESFTRWKARDSTDVYTGTDSTVLNYLGQYGWELVQYIYFVTPADVISPPFALMMVLKRRLEEE